MWLEVGLDKQQIHDFSHTTVSITSQHSQKTSYGRYKNLAYQKVFSFLYPNPNLLFFRFKKNI